MQAYELVELSALIAMNLTGFMNGQGHLPDARIGQYWSASRSRFDRWAKTLRNCDGENTRPGSGLSTDWDAVLPTLEEIFTGEILTRVWTAIACEHDRRRGSSYVTPVVRSVVLGHMQSRNRALSVMFRASKHEEKQVQLADRLRRRSERWTDMLLACLLPVCDIDQVAFDEMRAREFARDLQEEFQDEPVQQGWRLLTVSLKAAFATMACEYSPNADLNGRIASSIVACFRADMFECSSLFKSLWMERLCSTTEDAQAMIAELLES
jgi:hypothetical protein